MADAFSLPGPYQQQYNEIARRQKMAEMLQAQAFAPDTAAPSYNGIPVPVSAFSGLSKALAGIGGGYLQNKAIEEQKALGEKAQTETKEFLTALQGPPRAATQPTIEDPEASGAMPFDRGATFNADNTMTVPGTPAGVTPLSQAQRTAMLLGGMTSGNPFIQNIAGPLYAQSVKSEIMKPGDTRLVGGVPVYTSPATPKFHVVDGNLVREPTDIEGKSTPSFTAPPKPEPKTEYQKLMNDLKALPEGDPQRKQIQDRLTFLSTHNPPVVVNAGDKSLEQHLASASVKQLESSTSSAQGAVGALNTIKAIRNVLDKENTNLGPLATSQQFMGQIAEKLGVNGKDAKEKLANTREVINRLATLELEAAKQMQGQGSLSNDERKLLSRAASGNIDDLTKPEAIRLMEILEKTSLYRINAHNQLLDKFPVTPASKSFLDVFRVDPNQSAPAKVLVYNPTTGRIE